MQTTFFVGLGFWVEGLEARHYEDHVSRNERIDKMGMTPQSLETDGYIGSKTKNKLSNTKRISSAIYLSFKPRFLGRMSFDLIFQAACLQVFSFRLHTFRILDKTYLPKPWILNLFQQSKPLICWVFYWLNIKKAHILILKANFSFAISLLQPGWSNTREPYLLRLKSRTFIIHMAVLKA